MDLRELAEVFRRQWWLVAAFLVLGLIAGAALALLVPARYTSVSTLAFEATSSTDYTSAYQGALLASERAAFYVPLSIQPRVTEAVATRVGQGLRADSVARSIEASAPADTPLLTVVVTDSSPLRAQQIATATAEVLAQVVGEVERANSPTSAADVGTQIVQAASFSPVRVSLNPLVQVLLGAVLGLVAGALVALLRYALDRSVRTREQLRRLTGAPVLGTIPRDKDVDEAPLLTDDGVPQTRVEAYRDLRTALGLHAPDDPLVLAVTSPRAGDGKTLTALNLAAVLAQVGRSVVVVGADLRRPRLAALLLLEPAEGLAGSTAGEGHRLQQWGPVDVLVAGPVPADPTVLLSSPTFGRVLDELRSTHDVILIDTPPVLAASDATLVVSRADATLLVVGHGVSTTDDVTETLDALRPTGTPLLGAVLTRDPARRREPVSGPTASTSPTRPVPSPAAPDEPVADESVETGPVGAEAAAAGSGADSAEPGSTASSTSTTEAARTPSTTPRVSMRVSPSPSGSSQATTTRPRPGPRSGTAGSDRSPS